MKALFFLLLLGATVILPFAFLKQPWAMRLWRRVRIVIVIYVLVVLISAIARLVLNWDDIYG